MSTMQSIDVHCTHSNADLCAGFEYFAQNKEQQLRQPRAAGPFANDKAIYHEEANVTPADFEEFIIEKNDSDVSDNEDESPNLELNADNNADTEKWNVEEPEESDEEDEDEDAYNDNEYDSSPSEIDEDIDFSVASKVRKNNDNFSTSDVNDDKTSISDTGVDEYDCAPSDVGDAEDPLPKRKILMNFCYHSVTGPSIVYIREMNSICLQDSHFAYNQRGSIKMLVKSWLQLPKEQRDEYDEKSKKKSICCKKGSVYHQIAEAEFAEHRSALDADDHKAVFALSDDLCPHEWYRNCWRAEELFFEMTPSQRDEYYEKVYHDRVSEKAYDLFTKTRPTDDLVEGSFCMECDFKNLNSAEKKCYLKKAEQIVQDYYENLKNGIDDAASFEDYDAIPVLLKYSHIRIEDLEAYNVYAMKLLPLLQQEKGIENLRGFELNLTLKQRWNSMESEEQRKYEKALLRINKMETEIYKLHLSWVNFYQSAEGKRIIYSELCAEEKANFNEKALQTRKQLLEDYPDLMEYYFWQHRKKGAKFEPYDHAQHKPPEYDVQMKEYPGKPFIIKQVPIFDWFKTADPKGIMEQDAFNTFAQKVCTHERDGLNVAAKWQKWFELSGDQQAAYYKKYCLNFYKKTALEQYIHDVDPENKEADMYCIECAFSSMDKAEMKAYMKKTKRLAKRKLSRSIEKVQKKLAKEERDSKRYYLVPKRDTSHLYFEKINAYYRCKKLVAHLRRSLELNAFYPYFNNLNYSFLNDPDNQHLPFSRVCKKVEQSFWDLPDVERKPYFDAVIRFVELKKLLDLHKWAGSYFDYENKDPTLDFYDFSEKDQATYEKKVLQARVQLLHDNPDWTDYFYFRTSWTHSDDEDPEVNLLVPTPFMCFIHEVRPKMEQDHKFKKMWRREQRWIMKKAWNQLSKDQKSVYYQKQRRVQDRVNVRQFFELFADLTFDNPEQSDEEIQTSS